MRFCVWEASSNHIPGRTVASSTYPPTACCWTSNWLEACPVPMRIQWDKIQPYGHIDIRHAEMRYVDGRWNTTGVVQAKGVNVRIEKCPYPAENLVGHIEIGNGYAVCQEMNGRVGGRHMKCAFRLPIRPDIAREKIFRIRMDGPVAIDNTLIDSLSARGASESKLESFVRSLHPQGAAHIGRREVSNGRHRTSKSIH